MALSLGVDEVHVWLARPASVDVAKLAQVLSKAERRRADAFRFERHRRESIVTRALMRTTLSRYGALAPADWVFREGAHGRPAVDPPCGLFINATNHPNLVACVVARTDEVGIDLEPLSRAPAMLEVSREVFAPTELGALGPLNLPDREDLAVTLWTRKEAYIKALGLGFSAPVREIVVDPAADPPAGFFFDVRDVHAGELFRLAVAVRGAGARPRVTVHEASFDT